MRPETPAQDVSAVAAALRSLDVVSLALLSLAVRHGRDDAALASTLLLEPAEVLRRRAEALTRLAADVGVESIDDAVLADALAQVSPAKFLRSAERLAQPRNGRAPRADASAPAVARFPAPSQTLAPAPAPSVPIPVSPRPVRRRRRPTRGAVALASLVLICGGGAYVLALTKPWQGGRTETAPAPGAALAAGYGRWDASDAPPNTAPHSPSGQNVYAFTAAAQLQPAVAGITPRVYVPETIGGVVDVIDPRTFKVTRRFASGDEAQHITPSWDMRWLYVNNELSDSLTVINPRSGKPVKRIPVRDPYNLYFTPDGRAAIVVAERFNRLEFRNPRTWKLIKSLRIDANGIDHMDFTADGRHLLVSAEFSGDLIKVDVRKMKIERKRWVGGSPIDIKVSPDGRVFYVANQVRSGVSVIDARSLKPLGFIPTGAGAHGLAVSRDARSLYVTNRLAGTISVINLTTQRVRKTWSVGESPDMIQLSPDGRQLWTTNRYHASVSVLNTRTGRVIARIPTGDGPHGLTYFPQPGRYSIGHNGVYR